MSLRQRLARIRPSGGSIPAARHDPDAIPFVIPSPTCAGLGDPPDPEPFTVAIRADTSGFSQAVQRASETINAARVTPAPQPHTSEPSTAASAPPTPGGRKVFREFIPALTTGGQISALCNTGRHYECTGCRCGCHPTHPLRRNA